MTVTATTLSAAISKNDRNIIVASATGFVVGYPVCIDNEQCKVLSITGTTIGLFRGLKGKQEAHANGSLVLVGPHADFNRAPGEAVGVPESGISVEESVNGRNHVTKLSFSGITLGTASAAAVAMGKKLYTLPAGAIQIKGCRMSVGIYGSGSTCDADTPDVGVGTVIASGATAVLSGTATFENILTGQTAGDCAGTAVNAIVTTKLERNTGDAHTIHLNAADTWAGAATITATGNIEIEWTRQF